MDKHFVNIDDLVRQRLSGSEEEERSGAWLNMRELLDKEMPQKRVGFFNWRRMFSGMAVLLLLGSISLGGYELSSSVRGTGAQGGATVGNNAVTTVLRAKGSISTSASDKNENQSVARIIASKGEPFATVDQSAKSGSNGVNASTIGATTDNTNTTNSGIAATSAAADTHTNTNSNNNNNTSTSNEYNTASQSTANQSVVDNSHKVNAAAATGTHHVSTSGNSVAHNKSNHTGSGVSGHVTGKKHNNTNPGSNTSELVASLPLAASSSTGTKNIAGNNVKPVNGPVAGNTVRIDNNGETARDATSQVSSNNGATKDLSSTSPATLLNAEKARKLPASKTKAHNSLATNTRVAAILAKAAVAKNATKHSNVPTNPSNAATTVTGLAKNNTVADLPVSSSTPAATSIAAKTSGIATGTAKVSSNKSRQGISTAPVAMHKPTTSVAKSGAASGVASNNKSVVDEAASQAEQDNSKKIEKLTLVYSEKYYKTSNDDGYFKMDTISLLRASNPEPAAKTSAKQSDPVSGNNTSAVAAAPTHGKAKASAANRNTAAPEEVAEEPVVNAAKSESATAIATNETSAVSNTTEESATTTAPAKKELNASKKSGGSKKMDLLNEKFNDLKYHVKGLQFAPGLTAGVNTTFFAPENFKGFQFGVTGELVLSDAVSVMGELKYFHRMNNNYSMEDNFYKYTQVGGQYRKDLQLNSYSFSTLHSVELPLSVRYTAGKFTFFAGGNFLYTFGINTGAVTMAGPATPAPTFVSSVGEDNAPKVHEQDFASRFGLGYLFGMSFQIAPNFSLDIRNVQTLWDNAGSEGAKYVSGQLYKNPSLQVSVGYRFGSKRSSED